MIPTSENACHRVFLLPYEVEDNLGMYLPTLDPTLYSNEDSLPIEPVKYEPNYDKYRCAEKDWIPGRTGGHESAISKVPDEKCLYGRLHGPTHHVSRYGIRAYDQ